MKNKHLYKKPEIEVLEIELENIVAQSTNDASFTFSEDSHGGGASRSKRINWDNE